MTTITPNNKFTKLVAEMLLELKAGKGEYLHVFHYGRLVAEGIDAARMITATAIVLENGYAKGLRLTPEQIELAYSRLPESDPSSIIKSK